MLQIPKANMNAFGVCCRTITAMVEGVHMNGVRRGWNSLICTRMRKPLQGVMLGILVFVPVLQGQQIAFPGAEGSGRYATGGRGGTVYEVTNLNNSGSGSLVDAVSGGNRTIVFRVSGTIALGSVILQPKSNTTIAGQTAPGDGICIKGRIKINAVSNIVIRYLRVRVDEGAANSSGDAIDIAAGTNVMIDHVTASYARDEGISCQPAANRVTVQWCIISEALTFENHSYGSLVRGDYGDERAYHHNLYAHNNNRNPRPGNYTATTLDAEGGHFDFRNNVVYNWKGNEPGYNADTNTTTRYNFIGNAYITGTESGKTGKIFKEDAPDAYGYFADNSYDGIVPADPWSQVTFNGFSQVEIDAYKARSYLIPMDPVTTTSPAHAKFDVLAAAGACFPKRDIIDTRIVNDVKNGTGKSISSTALQPEGAWPQLNSAPPPTDTDHDGMPDVWEEANGLNPNDAADRNSTGTDGFTMLETCLNQLAPSGTTDAAIDPVLPSRAILAQNYPNPFNPSTSLQIQNPRLQFLRLIIYDVLGREAAVLINARKPAGTYVVTWDAAGCPSGMYFCRLTGEKVVETIRMLMIK